jgi:hypothetical protein
MFYDFDNDVETGFQLATFQGPLCAEPVEGMAYFVEDFEIDIDGVEKEISECMKMCRRRATYVLSRTESHDTIYGFGNICCQRLVQERVVGLVTQTKAGDVYM